MVTRNLIIFSMITDDEADEDQIGMWLCETNFRMALFNAMCDILTELMPYCIIFVLNFNNFREIDKHEQYLIQQYSNLPTVSVIETDQDQ